jgi:hypothetical protein
VLAVPIKVNADLRPSRLVRSNLNYVVRSIITILRVFVLYKPLRFFGILAALCGAPGVLGVFRFLLFFAMGEGNGHIQSLIISGIAIVVSAALTICGLISDQAGANRILLEDLRVRALKHEISEAKRVGKYEAKI